MQRQDWLAALLKAAAEIDPDGKQAVDYMRARHVRVNFSKVNKSVGAFWTLFGNIRLNSQYYNEEKQFDDPYLLSLIVHEVRHLQQGLTTAVSVYGELDAWQLGFRIHKQLTDKFPRHPAAGELMALPLNFDRSLLRRASQLMREFAGKGYHSNWLPLYPWGKEIRYWFTRKEPSA